MKKLYTVFILVFAAASLHGQPTWTWINSINASNSQIGSTRMAADASGGFYIVGTFNGINRPFGTYTLSAQGNSDAFIAHYNNLGVCIWAKQFGDTLSATFGNAVAVDYNGDVYLCGSYSNIIMIDTNYVASLLGSRDIFLIKLNAAGDLIWYKSCGGESTDVANCLAVDSQNNVYMGGNFYFKAYFDGDSIGNNISNTDIYIVKFNSAGTLQWIKEAGGSQDDDCNAISVSNNHFYIGGKIIGFCNFGSNNISAVNSDGFIAQYDLSGNNVWVKLAGGAQNDYSTDLSTDMFGNAYLTGSVYQTAQFGNGVSLNVGNTEGSYIAKYTGSGTCMWVKQAGSMSAPDGGKGIATDSYGFSVLTGYFNGTASFGAGIPPLTSAGLEDAFIARYSPAGVCQFALKGGGTGADKGYSAVALSTHQFVVSGQYAGTSSFGTNSLNVPGGSSYASFVGLLPGTFTAIESPAFSQNPEIYPNPASDFISLPAGAIKHASSVTIINSLGQIVKTDNDIDHNIDFNIDVHHLPPGIYSVNAASQTSFTTFKFIITR